MLTLLRLTAVGATVCVLSCGGDDTKVPQTALVRVDDEPAGANCAGGGLAILSGVDSNRNGVLDPNEVTQTRYECTPKAAVSIDTNVSVSDCPNGGERVRTGIDTNGNGVLDDSEVTSTSFICTQTGNVFYGSLTLDTPDQLSQLQGYEIITGSLFVSVNNVTVPGIKQVGDTLTIAVDVDAAVTLPDLTQAGNIDFLLGSINAPLLTNVTGAVEYDLVDDVPPLTSVSLPALEHAGSIVFNGNGIESSGAITTLSLPALKSVSHFELDNQPLTTIDLPALQTVDTFEITTLQSLTHIAVPSLTSIKQELSLQSCSALSICTYYAMQAATVPSDTFYFVGWTGLLADASCATNNASTCGTVTLNGAPSKFHACVVPETEASGESTCDILFGGHLASFASAQQATAMKTALQLGTWIGFTDAATEGTWVWSDGSTAYVPANSDATFWSSAPADNNSINCAIFDSSGATNNVCSTKEGILCLEP